MKNSLLIILCGFQVTSFAQNNVGIGTSTPVYKLHVHDGNAGNDANIGISNALTGSGPAQGGRIRFFNNDFIFLNQESVGNIQFVTSAFTRMLVSSTGNVGIGTLTPSERLHVRQTGDFNKNVIYGYANQTSGSADYENTGIAGFGEGNGIASGFGWGFGIKGVGSPNGWGAVGVYAALETSVPTSIVLGNNFYALYADARNPPGLNRYAGVFMNGNVGIGTAFPAERLDVVGNIELSGLLILNNNSGVAGQVLVSNGSSSPTWGNLATPQVGFRAGGLLGSPITIPNFAITHIHFQSSIIAPDFNDGNAFNNPSGNFICPSSGLYYFEAQVTWPNITATASLYIYKNGSILVNSIDRLTTYGSAYNQTSQVSSIFKCVTGDIISIHGFQVSGSDQNISNSSATYFNGYKVY